MPEDKGVKRLGSRCFEESGVRLEGSPSGHEVIDEKDAFPSQAVAFLKLAIQSEVLSLKALPTGSLRLPASRSAGVATAQDREDRRVQDRSDPARDPEGGAPSEPPGADRVLGDGNDSVHRHSQHCRQQVMKLLEHSVFQELARALFPGFQHVIGAALQGVEKGDGEIRIPELEGLRTKSRSDRSRTERAERKPFARAGGVARRTKKRALEQKLKKGRRHAVPFAREVPAGEFGKGERGQVASVWPRRRNSLGSVFLFPMTCRNGTRTV